MTVQINGTTGVSAVQDSTITSAKIVDGTILPVDTQVGALPSMVRLNTANGYGSTNTMIRRFTTTITNQGTDITYADSATLGASFTINTNGVYAISAKYLMTSANTVMGISLNSSQLTTSISAINITDALSIAQTYTAGTNSNCSWTGYLPSGSIIRPHEDSSASSGTGHSFTITRVA